MNTRLEMNEVSIGKPLEWDLTNASGRRIFRKGFIFHSAESLQRIKSMELYYESDNTNDKIVEHTHQARTSRTVKYHFEENEEPNQYLLSGHFFKFLDYCIFQNRIISDKISNGQTDQKLEIYNLIKNIELLYDSASEACIGAVHLEFEEHPYSCLHPIYAALLALMMVKALGYTKQRCHSLLGACLTANLGMYSYHDNLVNRDAPLTDDQMQLLEQHPELGHRFLVANNIDDQLWLKIVIQSHERMDGSGYPKQLNEKKISLEARIYHTIDAYLAMIMPRAYRSVKIPKNAMQKLYKEAIQDQNAISIGLIKQLGIYPPGSCVLLNNNTLAIVVERNMMSSTKPKVAVVAEQNGRRIRPTKFVITSVDEFKIIEAVDWQNVKGVDPTQLWANLEYKTSQFKTNTND